MKRNAKTHNKGAQSKPKQSFSCRNTNIIVERYIISQIGCKIDLRSSIQFTKPINSNYHSSAMNDHVVKVKSMSLELVQSN